VREDQRGAPLHQPLQRLLDYRLVLRIDGRQRLVENQNRRIDQQGARDRETLALATREPRATLSDDRTVTVG
jgi:hypothetical protein